MDKYDNLYFIYARKLTEKKSDIVGYLRGSDRAKVLEKAKRLIWKGWVVTDIRLYKNVNKAKRFLAVNLMRPLGK